MTRALRVVLWIVVAAALVALLFTVVFPWFDRTFITDPTLGAAAGSTLGGVTPRG